MTSNVQAALIVISAPASVLPGALQSQTDSYAFYESTKTLTAALAVDISVPALYNISNPGSPGLIPASTTVKSYYLHHESVNNQLSTVTVGGTFPNQILGIIVEGASLDMSDPILGNPTTMYPTGLGFRGLEIRYPMLADSIFWSGNQIFISVKSTTAVVLDSIRVVTAVPEPSTIALLGIGALALCTRGMRPHRLAN